MSRKALFVGLEYPYEPDLNDASVNGILEFNKSLIEKLKFRQSDIKILVERMHRLKK
jgi:hypothetical protein